MSLARSRRRKRRQTNRKLWRHLRDRRSVVTAAGMLFARANRTLGSLLGVRAVVIAKGGQLSKAALKRDQSMGLSWSYRHVQRLDIGEFASAKRQEYNEARMQLGISHANSPAPWLPIERTQRAPQRPRASSDQGGHGNDENKDPGATPMTKKIAVGPNQSMEAPHVAVRDAKHTQTATSGAPATELVDVIRLCIERSAFSWTIIADNIDIMTKVKLMSKDNKNKLLHFSTLLHLSVVSLLKVLITWHRVT